MKRYILALALSSTLLMSGCSAQSTAQSVSNIIVGILNIVQAEIPQLPPSDQAAVQSFITLGFNLDSQANICIASAGNTKAKLATCLTTFASGLLSPTELTQLRILGPAAQKNVQLGATAAIIAINGILTQWGQPVVPNPAIASIQPTPAELHSLSARLQAEGYQVYQ
jgi:hypothetical protein